MTETQAIVAGDRRALARGLTVVEAGGDEAAFLLDALRARTGRGRRIGLTGPPGVGKSTLLAALVRLERAAGRRVGVVAVDPTSPFSGGALLGDRHRMAAEAADEGVFVRSMATRGEPGGLARAAPDALDLLDAAGFDTLILETVGVGQTEIEVASTADSVAVVLSPESGDAVQAMKAGLLEIADVLCVNKSDREGAEAFASELEAMLELRGAAEGAWLPPVVRTDARAGAEPLHGALDRHFVWLSDEGRLAGRRRRGVFARLAGQVARRLARRLLDRSSAVLEREADAICRGERSVLRGVARASAEILP
ncbi:MAG: methylmalonyl Co-A mutase-associated GTPase MeaB [Planctomycetaceae bacterium]